MSLLLALAPIASTGPQIDSGATSGKVTQSPNSNCNLHVHFKDCYGIRKNLKDSLESDSLNSPVRLTEAIWGLMPHFDCQYYWNRSERQRMAIYKATFEIVSQADQEILRNAILGTLPCAARKNETVKEQLGKMGRRGTLGVGIYIAYVVDSAGHGVSKSRLEHILNELRSINIDFEEPMATLISDLQRRISPLSSHAEVPLCYVGCSSQISRRIDQHLAGSSSSPSMQTFLTLTKRRFPTSGYHIEGYAVFYVGRSIPHGAAEGGGSGFPPACSVFLRGGGPVNGVP
jgi:hypothetical protein